MATQAFFFIPKLAFSPVAFSFSFLGRSLFDIPEYGSDKDPEQIQLNREKRLKYLEHRLKRTRDRRKGLDEKIQQLEKEIEALKKEAP